MPFCNKCGAQLEEGAKFCNSCGAPQQAAPQQAAPQQTAPQQDLSTKLQNLNNTEDTTSQFDANDIAQNKVMAILAYLGILVLVPILAAKDSKFARYHANQGLILFIVSIIAAAIGVIPLIGWIAPLACFILMIIGIINAAQGKAKQLPIIGKFVLLK